MKDTKCRNCKAMPLRVPFTASALNDLLSCMFMLSFPAWKHQHGRMTP